MYKFLYTIFISLVVSWAGVFMLLFKTSPDTFFKIFLFLVVFFVAITLTVSLFVFALKYDSTKRSGPRLFYRKNFKWSLFISFIATGTLGFSAFDILNVLNYGLFLLICIGIYFWLKSFR